MNEICKKFVKELVRVLLSACLAALSVESVGCIACGDGSSASFVSSAIPNK